MCQRGTPIHRCHEVLDGTRERRHVSCTCDVDERVGEVGAGAACQHGAAELSREHAGAHVSDTTKRVAKALSGREAQREELQHGRQLVFDASDASSCGERESLLARDDRHDGDERRQHDRDHPAATIQRRTDGENTAEKKAHDPPRELPCAELDDILRQRRLLQPARQGVCTPGAAPRGRKTVAHALPPDERQHGPQRGDPGGVGDITQIRCDARRQRGRRPSRHALHGEQHARAQRGTENNGAGDDRHGIHPNHRCGSGRRPSRIVVR